MKRAKDPRIGNKVIIINGLLGVKCDSNHTPSSFTSWRFFRLKKGSYLNLVIIPLL
jgi:hypothetical protein